MNDAGNQRLVQHIRRLAGDPPGAPSDSELLRRYLERREESAFAALVRRHGPMVFAVCQSVLRQGHDAEDAFQAAFLILARKAGAVRRHEGLGGWLHRVAYRVALKARADNLRRRQREAKAARSAAEEPSSDDLSWGELRAILHRELAALPESLRAPLVLCYLEGRTQEEAARQLGWPLSTVRGRLQRGREKLRRRLERRGVALTAALGAALTGQTLAETAVPSLTATTAATALAHAFLRPLLPIKLALVSAVVLSLGIVTGGVVLRAPAEPRPSESGDPDRSLTVAARRDAVDAHGDPLPDGAIARLGTVRFNHGQWLNHLFFSPDGKTIYSEGGGWLRVWDAATGEERGHLASVAPSIDHQLVLTSDGKKMISLNQENPHVYDAVRVWDLTHMKEIRKLPLPTTQRSEVSLLRRNALSPDGRLGAINMPTQMRLFDLTTGQELYKLAKGGKDIHDVVFAGNDRLVTADAKEFIDIWDARTGKWIRQYAHGAPVEVLAASPDGRWLATLEHYTFAVGRLLDKDVVHVWDLKTGAKKHTLAARPNRWFMSLHFTGDGKRLLTLSLGQHGSELTIWDVPSGARLREVPDVYGHAIAVSADGRRLAATCSSSNFELWDLETGHRLSNEDGRHAWAAAVFLSPAGNRAHTLGHHSLSTWDVQTGRRLESVEAPRLYGWDPPRRRFSPDGRYALSFTEDGREFQAVIWDVAAHRQLHTLPGKKYYTYLDSAFSPDSSMLAVWEPVNWEPALRRERPDAEAVIHIWDMRTGKELRSFKDSKSGWPGQLSFSADGKTLLVAGGKHVVGFDVANGKELFSWHMEPLPDQSRRIVVVNGKQFTTDPKERCAWLSLAVSPDGSQIACILDDGRSGGQAVPENIALFDARTGKRRRSWSDSGKPLTGDGPLCFSHDGQLLAVSDQNAIRLWETATGKEIRTFLGHRGWMEFLAFSHDDRFLASASWDSTVLIWDATGQAAKTAALTEAKLKECWNDLAAEDAGRAHRAVWTLIDAPRESVPFLKARLHPVKPVSREQIDRWIQALDADAFEAREKATAELENLGELAEPALRRVLENKPTLEQRRRIEPILTKLDAAIPSGDTLRSLRTVRVLEHAGTAEARRLLRELAGGAEGARLTQQAKAALARMDRRSP